MAGLHKYEEAVENYNHAIKYNQDNFEAYYNLANLLKTLKNYDEANKNYKKVIELNPNYSNILFSHCIWLEN